MLFPAPEEQIADRKSQDAVGQTPLKEPIEPDAVASPDDDVREKLQVSSWARFRPLVMRLHFYAGVFVAPFILTAPTRSAGFALPNGPRRDALSELRPYEAALVIIALAVFGYFAPLFALSLMVFIVVDVVLGWRKTRFAASHRSAP